MSWSLRIARVSGIDIKVHLTFVFIFLMGALQRGRPHGAAGAVFGAGLMVALFACVTLHELGHSLVAQRFGVPVREIVLLPLGGGAASLPDGRPAVTARSSLVECPQRAGVLRSTRAYTSAASELPMPVMWVAVVCSMWPSCHVDAFHAPGPGRPGPARPALGHRTSIATWRVSETLDRTAVGGAR